EKSSWHRNCFTTEWITIFSQEKVLTGRRNIQALLYVGAAFVHVFFAAAAYSQGIKPVVQAEIGHVGDTAHLEFRGLKKWGEEVQGEGSKKVTLSIPPIDDVSVTRLKGFSDPLISGVEVDKQGPDGTYVVSFELTQNDVESFDYLTDDPSHL